MLNHLFKLSWILLVCLRFNFPDVYVGISKFEFLAVILSLLVRTSVMSLIFIALTYLAILIKYL